jgi:hypothetical protein
MKSLLTALLCLSPLTAIVTFAQTSKDATVPVTAELSLAPSASVKLSWPNPGNTTIIVRRRLKGQGPLAWLQLVNYANTDLSTLTDNNVTLGQVYEYVVQRINSNNINAYGYAHVAVNAPVVDERGKILVFADSATAIGASDELQRLYQDLRGDGWQVIEHLTGPSSTVPSVKALIVADYNADPANVKSVLLLGSVPVPYSGNAAWDGHTPDHTGAWPCDAYYADINSNQWTDVTVNNEAPARPANKNVPGDGKFDQNFLPSSVELQIGRVDFRHINAEAFGAADQIALMKRYLLKNHRWRRGEYTVENKALVDDNFGYFGGEAFGSNGYRNAYPLVGEANVLEADFFDGTETQTYLLGYGCGPGSYSSAGGVGSSANFATDSVNIVFSNLFGSYHGDWDYESNPFMPSALASRGGILTCSWAGRPHHFYHALASGETIGHCMRETMNAQLNNGYVNASGKGGAHVALLGDPTLRAHVLKPATDLTLKATCQSVLLSWKPSADAADGYHVYRAQSANGPYSRLSSTLIEGNEYEDHAPLTGTVFYQVRAIKSVNSPGGGIYANNSVGIIQAVEFIAHTWSISESISNESAPGANDGAVDLSVSAENSDGPFAFQWSNGDSTEDLTGLAGGIYTVTITDLGTGCTIEHTAVVTTASSLDEATCFTLFQVSPNPGRERFNLVLKLHQRMELRVEVRDINGRLVWEKPAVETDALDLAVDLGHVPAGVYLISVRAGAQIFTRKFMSY